MIFLKAICLGVIEGLTEFLPISSTGHLILFDRFLQLSPDQTFVNAFDVMIQLPAILAVVVYFWKDLWPFLLDRAETRARFELWFKIVAAFLPAAVLGAAFDSTIDRYLMNPTTVATALLMGGVLLIVLENRPRTDRVASARDMSLRMAVAIGVIQCIAMVPGTSRSAATIIGAMALGASRFAAAEFSFFLAIPTMFGATAYKLMKHGLHFTAEQWLVVAVGSVVSFLVAYGVVAFLMNYIRNHNFKPFAWYRITLALVVFALLYMNFFPATP
ncbi:MAG: undecaprenyl-diphosphatase [Candidatus Hydrogenedentes bacterium]|nr:undecaprenyl-diphosphatase [Candidatus Hydrogenedentota bacterium]